MTRDALSELTRRTLDDTAVDADAQRASREAVRIEQQLAVLHCDVKLSQALLRISELRTARSFAL
jgi:hypothetical protein